MPFAGFKDWDACMEKMRKKYDEETAKKVCGKLKAKYENDAEWGKMFRCVEMAKLLGLSKEQAEIICAQKYLDAYNPKKMKTLSNSSPKEMDKMSETKSEKTPDFSPKTKKMKKAEELEEMQRVAQETTPAGQKGAKPTIESLRKKIRTSPKSFQLPLFQPWRSPKSQHKLQTKLEKIQPAEKVGEFALTMEQLLKRAEYAKSIKKKDSTIFTYDDGEVGDSNSGLNNVIKKPVILAKEMVQIYKNAQTGIEEKHFKSYDELKKAIQHVDQLPIIIEHSQWTVDDIVGYVKEFKADDDLRAIKGIAYFDRGKLLEEGNPPERPFLLQQLDMNMKIPVSIGFWTELGDGGIYNDEEYDFSQIDMVLNHLAVCFYSKPRCPIDKCGVGLDSEEMNDMNGVTFINQDKQYYSISNILEIREEKEITNKNEEYGDKILEQDNALPKDEVLKSEGRDLYTIMKDLLDYLGRLDAQSKEDAENFILSLLKGEESKMEDSEFKEEITALKNKIKEMEDSQKSKDELIEKLEKSVKEYEEKERKNLVDSIKKFSIYEDSELEGKCIHDLRVMADTVSKFDPSMKKPKVADKKQSTEIKEDAYKPEISPRDLFNDPNYKGE